MAQLAQQQSAQTQHAAMSLTKKQREIYVGNLTVGLVNPAMLKELFNGALSSMDPTGGAQHPVVNISLDPCGKFAFVEFRTEELATLSLHLDKVRRAHHCLSACTTPYFESHIGHSGRVVCYELRRKPPAARR